MFRFGGDEKGLSRWMVSLPVLSLPVQAYIIFGATPMLLGRPMVERLHAVVDFGENA